MSVLTEYFITVDCLLSWFPVTNHAQLQQPKMRRYSFRKGNEEPDVIGSHTLIWSLGSDGPIGPGTGLDSNNLVGSFISVHVNDRQEFDVELSVQINNTPVTRTYVIRPDTTTPFMISTRASRREERVEIADTALVLQGVIISGHRFNAADLVTKLFSGLGRAGP
jgi:hypothetical protein